MFLSEAPKFFGRRKGRIIRKAKTTLLEAFLPEVRLADDCRFDRQTMFGKPVDRVYLEIGFGNGEHLAGQALRNPSVGFIGAEVFQNGVANLLSLITGVKEGSNLPEKITLSSGRPDNIRVYDNDMRLLFPRIPDGFLDRIFVLFPDVNIILADAQEHGDILRSYDMTLAEHCVLGNAFDDLSNVVAQYLSHCVFGFYQFHSCPSK